MFKKFIPIIIVMCMSLMFLAPVYASESSESADVDNNMSIMPMILKPTEMYQYKTEVNNTTIYYYAPKGYPNVNVYYYSYGMTFYYTIIYYTDDATLSIQNGNLISTKEVAYMKIYTRNIEEVNKVLFLKQEGIEVDLGTEVQAPGTLKIYTKQKVGGSAAQDLYTYTQKNNITIPEPEVPPTEPGTDPNKPDDTKGLLQTIIDLLKPPDVGVLQNVSDIINKNLKGNKFFEGIVSIQIELSNLLNQDYSNPQGFYAINPFKITVGKEGSIDWGINNVSLLNFSWFFGNSGFNGFNWQYGIYEMAGGRPAVKSITDPLISAFLWLGFGWYLWHNLPDIISGDSSTIGSLTKSEIGTEKVYSSTSKSTKNKDGSVTTTTSKRRVK